MFFLTLKHTSGSSEAPPIIVFDSSFLLPLRTFELKSNKKFMYRLRFFLHRIVQYSHAFEAKNHYTSNH